MPRNPLEDEAVEMFRTVLNNSGDWIKDIIDPTLPEWQRKMVKHMVDDLGQQLLSILNKVYPDYDNLTLEELDL